MEETKIIHASQHVAITAQPDFLLWGCEHHRMMRLTTKPPRLIHACVLVILQSHNECRNSPHPIMSLLSGGSHRLI